MNELWHLIFPDRADIVVDSLDAVPLEIRSHRTDSFTVPVAAAQGSARPAAYYIVEYALNFLDERRKMAYYKRVR